MTYEKEIDLEIAGWTFKRIGKNIYKIYVTADPNSITMTGSDVKTQLKIPFPHRILRMHLYHTNSAYAASTNALTIILRRSASTLTPAKFVEDLFNGSATASKISEVYGEGFEYEAGIYDLILNSTNTDLIFPIFYLQKLEA